MTSQATTTESVDYATLLDTPEAVRRLRALMVEAQGETSHLLPQEKRRVWDLHTRMTIDFASDGTLHKGVSARDRAGYVRDMRTVGALLDRMHAAPATPAPQPAASPAPPASVPLATGPHLLRHAHSYDAKEEIKRLGGRWDAANKAWSMPSEETLRQARAAADSYGPAQQAGSGQPAVKKAERVWVDIEDARSFYHGTKALQWLQAQGVRDGWFERTRPDGTIERWDKRGPLPDMPASIWTNKPAPKAN